MRSWEDWLFEFMEFHVQLMMFLVLFKLLANRPRDLADVADILFVQGELDRRYMQQWVEVLSISDRLDKALIQE
jgi:hypothetical protein